MEDFQKELAEKIKSEVANCGKNEEFFIKVEVVADGKGKSGMGESCTANNEKMST